MTNSLWTKLFCTVSLQWLPVRFLIEYVYFEFIVFRKSKGLQFSFLVHLVEFSITSWTFETVYQLSLKRLTFWALLLWSFNDLIQRVFNVLSFPFKNLCNLFNVLVNSFNALAQSFNAFSYPYKRNGVICLNAFGNPLYLFKICFFCLLNRKPLVSIFAFHIKF